MPPAGLTPTCWPVASRKSRTASSMIIVTGRVAAGWTLPVEVLMKSAPAVIASQRGPPDVVVGLQLAGLEDHLQVRRAAVGAPARLADRDDLVVHVEVAAGQERAPVDHHVDLVGAGLHRQPGVGELDLAARPPAGERRGHGGDVDAAVPQRLPGRPHQVGIDADRRDRRDTPRSPGSGRRRLRAQRADLARGVHPLERGEVDHADREVDRERLGAGLDRPGGETGRALRRRPPGRHRGGRAGSGGAPRPRRWPRRALHPVDRAPSSW